MIDKKEIQRFISDSKNEDLMSIHSVNKYAFESYLTGLENKLLGKKGIAEEHLSHIKRMKRFLDRLTYKNCLFIFQSKLLNEQDKQIALLEQENEQLIKENIKLKKNIK